MTKPTVSAAAHRRTAIVQLFNRVLIAGGLIAAVPTNVLAEARVEGQPDAVRIEASESSVDEVLSALGTAFNLRYRASTTLDRPISGVYQGTLQRVLARVLEGYDFIVKNASGSIEVVVLGEPKGAPAAPAATAGKPSTMSTQVPAASAAQLDLLRRSLEGLRR